MTGFGGGGPQSERRQGVPGGLQESAACPHGAAPAVLLVERGLQTRGTPGVYGYSLERERGES